MKQLLAIGLVMFSVCGSAQTDSRVLEAKPIDVDGFIKEPTAQDQELVQIQSEIKKQKQTIILNKEKAKHFKELSKSVEKLSETTEEYIEEKKAAQQEIADYNAKVACLQAENPGPECDKFVRRRR